MNALAIEVPNILKGGNVVEKFLTASQIAKRFDVTTKTVTRWIEQGKLKGAIKINPKIKNSPFIVPEASVEEFEKTYER